MVDDDELRVNELRQFRKTSSHVMLEAHSHCEVPAGCGGVVLRWRQPGAPIGISFFMYTTGEAEDFAIDGQSIEEQRATLEQGEHVLSFVIAEPAEQGFLLFEASLHPEIVTARQPKALSQGDGRWRACVEEPPADWRLPKFDDSSFVTLVDAAMPKPSGDRKWASEHLQGRGAKGLGLPASVTPPHRRKTWLSGLLHRPRGGAFERVWIRFRFRVDQEGFS